jgi:hypothetical protein
MRRAVTREDDRPNAVEHAAVGLLGPQEPVKHAAWGKRSRDGASRVDGDGFRARRARHVDSGDATVGSPQEAVPLRKHQTVRPSQSRADTQPQLHPALLRLSAIVSQYFTRDLTNVSPRHLGEAEGVAVCHGLSRVVGKTRDGRKLDMWWRTTYGRRRTVERLHP